MGVGLEDEWGSVLKLPKPPYHETPHSFPGVASGWGGWEGCGKRDRDGMGIKEGSPHTLGLVFQGSETDGWRLRNSGDSLSQRSDVDLDLDLSLITCFPVSEDWSGQITNVQGEPKEESGVELCLDFRL